MSDLLRAAFGPDPVAAIAAAFLIVNLTVGASILTVAIARPPLRRVLGPALTYELWLVPLFVLLATLLTVFVPTSTEAGSLAARAARLPHLELITPVWAFGAAALASVFGFAQARFEDDVSAGRGGPAVVGLISPRIVLPADDGTYSAEERGLIRAHERAHVARKDPRAAALAATFQCLCWFNPFAHLAAYLIRLDQELACDAAVMLSRPGDRALYARTLLKTQLAATPLPFGCYWPARGLHPLEVRVGMLKRRTDKGPQRPGACVVLPSIDPIRP